MIPVKEYLSATLIDQLYSYFDASHHEDVVGGCGGWWLVGGGMRDFVVGVCGVKLKRCIFFTVTS